MPTVKTIGTSGRQYSTIAAWIAYLPADLTGGDIEVGELYNDSAFTPSYSEAAFTGHTTDSTHYIKLTTASGQSFLDHADKATNALRYNSANGVVITSGLNYGSATVYNNDNYTVFSNLQIRSTTTKVFLSYAISPVLDSCIMYNTAASNQSTAYLASSTLKAINCLFYTDGNNGGVFLYTGANLYNCTVAKTTNTGSSGNAVHCQYGGTSTLENVAIFGFSAHYSGTAPTFITCASDLGSPPSGVTGSLTYADQFENTGTVIADTDFRLKSGTDLQNAGTTDTTNVPSGTDIIGTARSSWDIGCWEIAPPSGNPRHGDFFFAGP